MAWTTPAHVTSGAASSSQFNAETVDNLQYLFDQRPYGWLGYAEVTASQAGISTETDLTSLTVTVTVAASRKIRITGHGLVTPTSASGIYTGYIKESTTKLGRWAGGGGATANFSQLHESAVIVTSPSAGSHTYKLSLECTAAGTASLTAAAGAAAFILVEDLGHS